MQNILRLLLLHLVVPLTGKMESADNVDNSTNANADQEYWGLQLRLHSNLV